MRVRVQRGWRGIKHISDRESELALSRTLFEHLAQFASMQLDFVVLFPMASTTIPTL